MENTMDFKYRTARRLPVILLLDTSGSMFGEKIDVLNSSIQSMLNDFASVDSSEVEICVAIYQFGPEAQEVLPLMSAAEAEKKFTSMSADGSTPLGSVLRLAKNSLLENREAITSRDYRPIVLLASDGEPNDSWETAFEEFCSEGRSAKCTRMAIAIGVYDGDKAHDMLKNFVTKDQKVFSASDAREIRAFFQIFSQTTVAKASSITATIKSEQGLKTIIEEDDDDIF